MYLHMAHSVVNTDQADFAKKVVVAGSTYFAYVRSKTAYSRPNPEPPGGSVPKGAWRRASGARWQGAEEHRSGASHFLRTREPGLVNPSFSRVGDVLAFRPVCQHGTAFPPPPRHRTATGPPRCFGRGSGGGPVAVRWGDGGLSAPFWYSSRRPSPLRVPDVLAPAPA